MKIIITIILSSIILLSQAQTSTIQIPSSTPPQQIPGMLESEFMKIYESKRDTIERIESHNIQKITVMSVGGNTGKPKCVDGFLITVYSFMNWQESPGRYYYKYFFLSGAGPTYHIPATPAEAEGSNVDLASEPTIALTYSPNSTCSFFALEVRSAEKSAGQTKATYLTLLNWDDDKHDFTYILSTPLNIERLGEDPQEWRFSFIKSNKAVPDIIMNGATSKRYQWDGATYK